MRDPMTAQRMIESAYAEPEEVPVPDRIVIAVGLAGLALWLTVGIIVWQIYRGG